MEKSHDRIDPLALLVGELKLRATTPVSATLDAGARLEEQPHTVVQVARNSPATNYTRWNFDVTISLHTFSTTTTRAYNAHCEIADIVLSLVNIGNVHISAVTCVNEPLNITSDNAPQFPGVMSTYRMYFRKVT